MKALGLIEVSGYLAAVEAADAALKAANVTLLGLEKVKAGITTVEITGDVGAVKAAVDAGAMAAESLGLLRAINVIPRLHEETLKIIPLMAEDKVKDKELKKEVVEITEEIIDKKLQQPEVVIEPVKEPIIVEPIDAVPVKIKAKKKKKKEGYDSLTVEELRRKVRKLNRSDLNNQEIKFAKKDLLIKILKESDKEGDK